MDDREQIMTENMIRWAEDKLGEAKFADGIFSELRILLHTH